MMKRKPVRILVTGGARSGKSRYALERAREYGHPAIIVTATAFDEEMRDRIRKHRAERKDAFLTLEEPMNPAGALGRLAPDTDVVVIDCLTVWLGNLMHHYGGGDDAVYPETTALLQALKNPPCDVIVVTNEVGMGIVPDNSMARLFRDMAGRLNAAIAQEADKVVLLVSGIPVVIKGEGEKKWRT